MIKELTYKEIFLNIWRYCKLPTLVLLIAGGFTIKFHLGGSVYSPILGIALLTVTSIYMMGLAVSWLKRFREAMEEERTEQTGRD